MSTEERLRVTFDKFDRDGSGTVEAKELVGVLRESVKDTHPHWDDAKVDGMAKRKAAHVLVKCDKDNDHKLTWEEFLSGLSSFSE